MLSPALSRSSVDFNAHESSLRLSQPAGKAYQFAHKAHPLGNPYLTTRLSTCQREPPDELALSGVAGSQAVQGHEHDQSLLLFANDGNETYLSYGALPSQGRPRVSALAGMQTAGPAASASESGLLLVRRNNQREVVLRQLKKISERQEQKRREDAEQLQQKESQLKRLQEQEREK